MKTLALNLRRLLLILGFLLTGPALATMTDEVSLDRSWRTTSPASAGIAPDPATTPEAVVQVYGARTVRWRGAFAVHTWISVKPEGAANFTTHEVIGWRFWQSGNALRQRQGSPDRPWFGATPELYAELRGEEAATAITQIEAAIATYPFTGEYKTWPGPNSNTFTASIARQVPALALDLPPTAVGKDYLGETRFLASAPSGTGYQLSLFGLLGGTLAVEEGLEINILGLSFGIDPLDLAIKLPGLGRIAATAG
ncbi:DUF3750 domain-containing protein [Pelagibius litoralis]|uniref:DUF3750 domain-containing protein n=1 Tax=Pelagibius litoralis TaxID=374515 RepID=A0A967CBU5_9PROT|nr:DUF3750 domain-containing protein [Pelagibius litoralis]NIA68608.1 DUF3750 domain-containing protein [Pelagibius litoralis]